LRREIQNFEAQSNKVAALGSNKPLNNEALIDVARKQNLKLVEIDSASPHFIPKTPGDESRIEYLRKMLAADSQRTGTPKLARHIGELNLLANKTRKASFENVATTLSRQSQGKLKFEIEYSSYGNYFDSQAGNRITEVTYSGSNADRALGIEVKYDTAGVMKDSDQTGWMPQGIMITSTSNASDPGVWLPLDSIITPGNRGRMPPHARFTTYTQIRDDWYQIEARLWLDVQLIDELPEAELSSIMGASEMTYTPDSFRPSGSPITVQVTKLRN
jgi:hypothetical protein